MPVPLRVLGVPLVAVAIVGAIGLASYRKHVAELERDTIEELAAIRTLKTQRVQAWREMVRADAQLVRTIPSLVEFVNGNPHGHAHAPGAAHAHDTGHEPAPDGAPHAVSAHLESVIEWIRRNYEPRGYRDIRVLAPGDAPPAWGDVPDLVRVARGGGDPTLSQFFRPEAGAIQLTAVAPIARPDGAASGFVLLLTVDPDASQLTPAIQEWPGPSRTGETLLVRRDGDDVVFLSDLRHAPGAALRLRRPMRDANLAAVLAVQGSTTGPAETTVDYRGEPVLAAMGTVPGSDWAVVAKLDVAEVYAPLNELLAWTWIALAAVLVAGVATAMWRVQRGEATALRHQASARVVEQRLALAVRASGVGLWDRDMRTNALFFSPEFKRQLGYGDDELESSLAEWDARLHPDDRERVHAYIRAYLASPGEEYSQEFRLRHRDGSYRHILSRARAEVEDGRVVRMMGCHVDLTPLKQLEAQVRRAQKLEAVGRLAGGIAHDFNNLLTVINGTVALLLEEPLDADVATDLVQVQRAGESAAQLTRQLLLFSRPVPEKRQRIDLNEVLRQWQPLLRRTLGDDVIVELQLADAPARVLADAAQIEQAVMNLVVNARDAMPSGGGLTISTASVCVSVSPAGCTPPLNPGDYWVLSVEDSGTGISEDALPHIFDPFFTTKEPGKGTGLGLAIVYGVAAGAGGGVGVHTTPAGTTFSIFLPATTGDEGARGDSARRTRPARTRTVLVVDDDASVREVVARTVRAAGYAAEAMDAAAALARSAHASFSFDVLLTDVTMPGVSGAELASCLRSMRGGLGVVFMTGCPTADLVDRIPPGATIIRKPPSIADLVGALDAA